MRPSRLLYGAALALSLACHPHARGPAAPAANQAAARATSTAQKLAAAGAVPCPNDPSFRCVKLTVPLDRARPNGKTIGVVFAVHPAPPETRAGVLVAAVGGPGYSGVSLARTWDKTDPRLAATFDIVWFDLRGVGLSGGLECPRATAAFYEGGLRSASAEEDRALAAKSRAFARDCIAELGGAGADMASYETREAVEDIEALRELLGEDKLTLYGMSYGTQLMQTYAATHPRRVRAVVLDGVIDVGLGHVEAMQNLGAGAEKLFGATVAACASRPSCAAPFGGAPGTTPEARILAAYDAIAARLERAAATISWRTKSGVVEPRRFTRNDLDTTTFNALYDADLRRDLMAALGEAHRSGDLTELLRLSYRASEIDPETAGPNGTANADPDMSNAIYYAFTCNDFGRDAPSEDGRLHALLRGGEALRNRGQRLLSPYFGDLPCAYWPVRREASSRPAVRMPAVPVLLISATGDSATPSGQADAVFRRLPDGRKVTVDGGHHVMFGKGNACVDRFATEFLLADKRPLQREIRCEGALISE